jgi:chaperonin GroES
MTVSKSSVNDFADEGIALDQGAKQSITMLSDRVLVKVPPSQGERRSRSGMIIPATAQIAKRLSWSDVAAVGPNARSVKVGDTVLFNAEECAEVEVKGETYLLLRERDIHALAAERNDSGTGLYL